MAPATLKSIQCPRCKTPYKVKSEARGHLKCRSCGALLALGEAHPPRGSRTQNARDRQDTRTMLRLFMVAGGVLLVIVIAVLVLSQKASPVRQELPQDRSQTPPRIALRHQSRPDNYILSDNPEIIQREFLEALARGNKAGIRKLFLFPEYYHWARQKYQFQDDSPFIYDKADAKHKQELESMVLDELLADPELQEYLKLKLLPGIENGSAKPENREVTEDHGRFEYLVQDKNGANLFSIVINVRLKEAFSDDPWTAGQEKKNWGVWRVQVKYYTDQLGAPKADKKAVDQVFERKRKRERAERVKKHRQRHGRPAEVEPSKQEQIAGIGPTQLANIQKAVRALLDRSSSGPEMNHARETLTSIGRPAIPNLLNALLSKDHAKSEDDILQSMPIILLLRDITGQDFGYGPPTAGAVMGGHAGGLAGATPEQRLQAIRRWFGWWKRNKKSWSGRAPQPGSGGKED